MNKIGRISVQSLMITPTCIVRGLQRGAFLF